MAVIETKQESGLVPLERAPTYRLVHDAIEREILAGRLKIGDPLPAELQLAERFKVNRSTVREGIRLLEKSGLVERKGGKRPRIAAPRYRDLASAASRALILHAVTFRELWEASMVIEPSTAEFAARNITEADIAKLSANIAEMEESVERLETGLEDKPDGFVDLDRKFHELLVNATGNRVLILAHEPVTTLFIPAGRLILPRLKTYRRVLDAHRHIFDFLKKRDPEGAGKWMHRHMDDFRRGYELTGLDFDTPLEMVNV
ncbi:MAG: FadR/GntR family transcriptional regulator [Rhizomicrobium sp.]